VLAELGGMLDREKIVSPAIIVVGEVVLLSDADDRLGALAAQAEAMS
jgi:uroporphyrin-III C-methyltransferase